MTTNGLFYTSATKYQAHILLKGYQFSFGSYIKPPIFTKDKCNLSNIWASASERIRTGGVNEVLDVSIDFCEARKVQCQQKPPEE